jgi:hypothetical protein
VAVRIAAVIAVVAVAVGTVVAAAADRPPEPVTVLAAGEIADCTRPDDARTAAIVAGESGTVLMLGGSVRGHGTLAELQRCYGPTWGRFRDRTKPVPGEDEYETPNAAGFRSYFGVDRTYDAFVLGTWRVYALDSERVTKAQLDWLRRDLERNPHRCVLAFWHEPLFASGSRRSASPVRRFWRILYRAKAELVLNADNHAYERFLRLRPDGEPDWQHGLREFVVGTGGRVLFERPWAHFYSRAFNAQTHGILRLRLGEDGYSWRFLSVDGSFEDNGGEGCR